MEIGLSTLEEECASQGLDWEEVLEQRAREKNKMKELGLTEADLPKVMSVAPTTEKNSKNENT